MLSGFLFVVSQNMFFGFVFFCFVFSSPCIFTKRKVKFMFMNRALETRTIYLRSPVRAPRGQVNIVLGLTLKGLLSWESE